MAKKKAKLKWIEHENGWHYSAPTESNSLGYYAIRPHGNGFCLEGIDIKIPAVTLSSCKKIAQLIFDFNG